MVLESSPIKNNPLNTLFFKFIRQQLARLGGTLGFIFTRQFKIINRGNSFPKAIVYGLGINVIRASKDRHPRTASLALNFGPDPMVPSLTLCSFFLLFIHE